MAPRSEPPNPSRAPHPTALGWLAGLSAGVVLGLACLALLWLHVGILVVLPVIFLGGAWRKTRPFWAAFFLGLAAATAVTLALGYLLLISKR